MNEKLIVALDIEDRQQIIDLATSLRDDIKTVKVGLEAFIAHGPELVSELKDLGLDIFLDLKVNDIPRTAAAAAREANKLGVSIFTVHATGGSDMIEAVKDTVGLDLNVIAVTVLTSLNKWESDFIYGSDSTIPAIAKGLGKISLMAGADGLVCSVHELKEMKFLGGSRVVPGIRPEGSVSNDQKRIGTPTEAISNGADWIVVGRPITLAKDPRAAAQKIIASMEAGS